MGEHSLWGSPMSVRRWWNILLAKWEACQYPDGGTHGNGPAHLVEWTGAVPALPRFQDSEQINRQCFKSLSFGVVCYIVRDHQNINHPVNIPRVWSRNQRNRDFILHRTSPLSVFGSLLPHHQLNPPPMNTPFGGGRKVGSRTRSCLVCQEDIYTPGEKLTSDVGLIHRQGGGT